MSISVKPDKTLLRRLSATFYNPDSNCTEQKKIFFIALINIYGTNNGVPFFSEFRPMYFFLFYEKRLKFAQSRN